MEEEKQKLRVTIEFCIENRRLDPGENPVDALSKRVTQFLGYIKAQELSKLAEFESVSDGDLLPETKEFESRIYQACQRVFLIVNEEDL